MLICCIAVYKLGFLNFMFKSKMKSIVCIALFILAAAISSAQQADEESGKCETLANEITTYLGECRAEIGEIQVQQNDSVSEIDTAVVEEEEEEDAGDDEENTEETEESPENENSGKDKKQRQDAANAVTKKYPIAVCIISRFNAVDGEKINYGALIERIQSESIEDEVKEKILKKLQKCSEHSGNSKSKKHKNMPLLRDIMCIAKSVIKPCGKKSSGFESLAEFLKLKKIGFGKGKGNGKGKQKTE